MYCGKCGAEIDKSAAKCPSCGEPVKPSATSSGDETIRITVTPADTEKNDSNTSYQNTGEQTNYVPNYSYIAPQNQPVSVGRWLGRMFLTWIPLVGGLVYLIMLIVWACSDRFEASSKNWAIASLIMIAINIAAGVLIFCLIVSLYAGSIQMLLDTIIGY